MNVYVESNFVLELALKQEQYESCEKLLSLCESGKVSLLLPAFSIAEPFETVIRRAKDRMQLVEILNNEIDQLSRSVLFKNEIGALPNVAGILTRSCEQELQELYTARNRILSVAEIIPLEQNILTAAVNLQTTSRLEFLDAIVYASVLEHLRTKQVIMSCFLNKDFRDFNDPEIEDNLKSHHCKLLFSFESGYNYVKSQLKIRNA
ncbi:MAG: PIN domain-containing protein [bacterium]